MKGHSARGQVFEDGLNIVLRPTRNTNVDVCEVKADKLIHKVEDLFSRRWNGRRNWTLVERIHDDVSRSLRPETEHFFEAFHHGVIARFLYSTFVCKIELGEYVATGIGRSRKLDE
jgi:hypothetical protein